MQDIGVVCLYIVWSNKCTIVYYDEVTLYIYYTIKLQKVKDC
jgi:hypothetical protein